MIGESELPTLRSITTEKDNKQIFISAGGIALIANGCNLFALSNIC